MNLSVQLWSVHDVTDTYKGFIYALERISEMGYDGVEFAGFGGIEANEMRSHLERLSLKASGAHVSLNDLRNNLDNIIIYCREIDCRYIICPYAETNNYEETLALRDEFKEINRKISKAGLVFGYHNHAHEFVSFKGEYAFDILLSGDNSIVYELDTFWSEYAGVNTCEYLKKIGKRCPLVHLKDMRIAENSKKESTVFGDGILDNAAIIDAAKKYCQPEWFIIEWEAFDMNSLNACDLSLQNLKKYM